MRMVQNEPGSRSAQDAREGNADDDQRQCLCFCPRRKPITQVQSNTGKLSRFREPKSKARDIKLMGRLHNSGESGD